MDFGGVRMGIFNVYAYNDTFVSKYSSNKNYSYKSYLCVGETLRNNISSNVLISFLNFDIYRKHDSLDIVSARLYLYVDSELLDNLENAASIGIYEIIQPYNAETVTWASAPEIKATRYSINNLINGVNGYISIDITELIQSWDSFARPIYGIALLGKRIRDAITITSSRGQNKPYIKIETLESRFSNPRLIGVTGATGATGPQGNPGGPIGPMGIAGPIGPQGQQGIKGPTGPRGLQGNQGIQGPEGAQGHQGAPGPVGPIGPVGLMGPVGPQGPIGPQGPEGVQGPVGPVGLVGSQGEQGPVGPQGPQGVRGSTGIKGPIGLIGMTGATGNVGIQGPPGPQGPQGPFGIKGDTGQQGVQGIKGDTGAPGTIGPTGLSITGATGASVTGEIGPTGATGIQGLIGPIGQSVTGPTGATGSQGIKGEKGDKGATGQQGIQGRRGEQGIQGIEGPSGKAGITPIIPSSNNGQLINRNEKVVVNQEIIKLMPVVINGTDINEFEEGLNLLPSHTYWVSWSISSKSLDIHQTFGGHLILNGVAVQGSFNMVGPVFCPGDILTSSASVLFTVQDNISVLNLQYLTTSSEVGCNELTYAGLNIIELS